MTERHIHRGWIIEQAEGLGGQYAILVADLVPNPRYRNRPHYMRDRGNEGTLLVFATVDLAREFIDKLIAACGGHAKPAPVAVIDESVPVGGGGNNAV